MADTTDTPPAAEEKPAPAPRRRAAPRKAATKSDAAPAKRTPAKRSTAKGASDDAGVVASVSDAVEKAEASTTKAARSAGAAATRAAKKVEDAATTTTRKAAVAIGAVKPRAGKRSTPRTPAKRTAAKAPERSTLSRTTDRVGGKWGAAAVVGGLAAAGAAAAALLSIRSSTPADADKRPAGGTSPDDGAKADDKNGMSKS